METPKSIAATSSKETVNHFSVLTMDFKLALQPRCDFCQRFLLRLHNCVKTTVCHATVYTVQYSKAGVRSTIVDPNIYRSAKFEFRLELRAHSQSRPVKNIQEHHRQSSLLVFSKYVIPENFRYGMMDVLQF